MIKLGLALLGLGLVFLFVLLLLSMIVNGGIWGAVFGIAGLIYLGVKIREGILQGLAQARKE